MFYNSSVNIGRSEINPNEFQNRLMLLNGIEEDTVSGIFGNVNIWLILGIGLMVAGTGFFIWNQFLKKQTVRR